MKKKWINIALACGTAVLFATGCATNNKRQQPQPNTRDLLRNRDLVPPPFSSPDAVKGFAPAPSQGFPGTAPAAPQRAAGAVHPGSVAILPPEGAQPAIPSNTESFVPLNDPFNPFAGPNESVQPITSMFNESEQPKLVAVSSGNNNLNATNTITRPVRPSTIVIPPPNKPASPAKPATTPAKPAGGSAKPATTPAKPAAGSPKPTGTTVKPVAGQQTYTVVAGDTLSDIGYRYGVSWKAIAELNGISETAPLRLNQKLVLPANALATPRAPQVRSHSAQGSKAPATPVKPAKEGTYSVRAGDSLWTIAKANHIKFNDIQTWNPDAVNKPLKIGQLINIKDPKGTADAAKPAAANEATKKAAEKPAATTAPATPAPLPPVPPAPTKKETSGTVIGGINNANVVTLAPAAEKKDNAAPAKSEETLLSHTVQAEDDLKTIALMYGANTPAEIADKIKEIKAKNPTIQSDKDLKPGAVIRVPYTPVVP